jgi:hypothetical protein
MLIACAVIVADVQLDAALARNHFGERWMTTFYPMGRYVNRADGRHIDEFPCVPIANPYYR